MAENTREISENNNENRYPQSSRGGGNSLVEVVDRILDKGIVIDAWVSVSVIGIELVTIEARVIVASLETYLKHAEKLKYIGPVAGGFLADKQHQTLGEAVGNLSQGVGQGVGQLQHNLQGLPIVGQQRQTQPENRNRSRSQSQGGSKNTRSKKSSRSRGRKKKK